MSDPFTAHKILTPEAPNKVAISSTATAAITPFATGSTRKVRMVGSAQWYFNTAKGAAPTDPVITSTSTGSRCFGPIPAGVIIECDFDPGEQFKAIADASGYLAYYVSGV